MIANYWRNLNERERWMVAVATIFVLIYLFYLLVYSPLSTKIDFKSKQLIEKQETLLWMQQVQRPQNQKIAKPINNAKLLALIGHQLNSNSLQKFIYQLQQTASGDIQLSYDRVPYNLFLSWLWSLSNDYAITLKQFAVERSDTPGIVKLTIIITAK